MGGPCANHVYNIMDLRELRIRTMTSNVIEAKCPFNNVRERGEMSKGVG